MKPRDRLNPFYGQRKFGCIAHFMDASALIKFFVDEDGSDRIRTHVHNCLAARRDFEIVFRTTYLCFGETLGYFKTKRRRRDISHDQYADVASRIMESVATVFEIQESIPIAHPVVQASVMEMIRRHGLDATDAFQLIAARSNNEAHVDLVGGMESILVSADADLVRAARAEDIRAWNIVADAAP